MLSALTISSSIYFRLCIVFCGHENDGPFDIFLESKSKSPEKLAAHIHRYFAHASPQKLKEFFKTTSHEMKDKISKALDEMDCEIFKKYKKEATKPQTCLPLADSLNQTIAL